VTVTLSFVICQSAIDTWHSSFVICRLSFITLNAYSSMYPLLRPLLFRLDPEQAHTLTLGLLRWAGYPPIAHLLGTLFAVDDPRLEVEAFGVKFKNPVGLAAGYDKNGVAVRGLSCLGLGHIEVGTLTRLPQAGNPRPRVHRVPEAQALINSMGFPNKGIEALKIERGAARLGINIGRGKDTPPERAAADYVELLKRVHSQADYVAINVSSPNTPGLRQLQARTALEELLTAVTATRHQLRPRVPLLVKIAPDLAEAELDDLLDVVMACGVDGVIATNTTVSREGVPATTLNGGLSGTPLRTRATEMIRAIARRTEGRLPIIGVGGIMNAADALEKLRAGASLVQVYTGLIYAGPGLVRQIHAGLLKACDAAGAQSVQELTHTAWKVKVGQALPA
jgi:dihydroorotate dehydrogenase